MMLCVSLRVVWVWLESRIPDYFLLYNRVGGIPVLTFNINVQDEDEETTMATVLTRIYNKIEFPRIISI